MPQNSCVFGIELAGEIAHGLLDGFAVLDMKRVFCYARRAARSVASRVMPASSVTMICSFRFGPAQSPRRELRQPLPRASLPQPPPSNAAVWRARMAAVFPTPHFPAAAARCGMHAEYRAENAKGARTLP